MDIGHRLVHPHRLSGFLALEINYFLSQLAVGMVTLFGVVFIYRLGATMYQGLLFLIGFYGVQRILVMLELPFLPRIIPKIGYRRLIALSLMAELLKVLSFALTKQVSVWFLVPGAAFGSLYLAAYELGFHGLFLDENDDQRLGEQISMFDVLQNIGLMIVPVFMGILIDKRGFGVLFAFSAVILGLSIVPLLFMRKHHHPKHEYSFAKVANLVTAEPEFTGSVSWWYITMAVSEFFWPIYIVTLGKGYAFLGGLKSLVLLGSSISVYMLGRFYDKRPLKQVFIGASLVEALMWVVRFSVSSAIGLVAADVTGKIMNPVWWLKIRRYELEIGERVEKMVFSVAHELMVSAGLLIGLITGVWLLVLSGGQWSFLAIPAVLGILVSAWLVRKE
jgi:hypothetical protein